MVFVATGERLRLTANGIGELARERLVGKKALVLLGGEAHAAREHRDRAGEDVEERLSVGALDTATGVGALGWLAVVNSGAAVLLLFVLLRRGTAAAASGLLYLVPPVTAVLAVPVLGQPLEPQTLVGLAVTLAGVLLVQRATRPARSSERQQGGFTGAPRQ